MAKSQDVNSTEKLLNVIRGAQALSTASSATQESARQKQKYSDKISLGISGLFSSRTRFTVGVDISQESISLAKTVKTTDGKLMLVDQKIVKYGDGITQESSEFKNLLKSSLADLSGPLDNCDIWAVMNATEVNVSHLQIPRVPKKQLENVVYWTAKKENPVDEKDVVFDFEMQGEVTDKGIPKYAVMVYTAPRAEVEKVRKIFSDVGVNLAGITIAPFAIQNIFRAKWISVVEGTFASLFIGNDFSRIDIYSKNNLVMTRGIKTGVNSMMEAIEEYLAEESAVTKISREDIKKGLLQFIADPGKSLDNAFPDLRGTEQEILDIITPALERLTRQIERTLEYYASSVGYEKVEKLYVSSVLNVFYQPLLNYLTEQLGARMEFFDPFAGKDQASSVASMSLSERASLVPAIGLSLSDRKYTPNAIFTYVEKKREINKTYLNRGIFATFAALLTICVIILASQAIETRRLGSDREKLQKELSLFTQLLSKDKITAMADELKLRRQLNRQYAKKYQGMALLGELASLTPDNIRLINVRIVASLADVQPPVKDAAKKETGEGISIEGVVLADRNTQDGLLAQYVMKLENSPMFQDVSLQKSSVVNFKKREILQFTIKAKVG